MSDAEPEVHDARKITDPLEEPEQLETDQPHFASSSSSPSHRPQTPQHLVDDVEVPDVILGEGQNTLRTETLVFQSAEEICEDEPREDDVEELLESISYPVIAVDSTFEEEPFVVATSKEKAVVQTKEPSEQVEAANSPHCSAADMSAEERFDDSSLIETSPQALDNGVDDVASEFHHHNNDESIGDFRQPIDQSEASNGHNVDHQPLQDLTHEAEKMQLDDPVVPNKGSVEITPNPKPTTIEKATPLPPTAKRTGIRPPSEIKNLSRVLASRAETPSSIGIRSRSPASSAAAGSHKPSPPKREGISPKPTPKPVVETPNPGGFTPKTNAKYANVRSKVGSITQYTPSAGKVEIFSEKRTYNVKSKVASLGNANHTPGGGNVKIESSKLNFSAAAKPRVASKADYVPAKSDKKIVSEKLQWNVAPKVGSLENAKHKPTGGNVQIHSEKLTWNAESKVGSKENMKHKPGGGNVKSPPSICTPNYRRTPMQKRRQLEASIEPVASHLQTIVKPTVCQVASRPVKPRTTTTTTMATGAALPAKRVAARLVSSRQSSGSNLLRTSMPGAIYPLTADQIFSVAK